MSESKITVSLQYRFGLLPACLLTTRTTSATSIHTYICDDGAVKWTSDDHTRVRTPGTTNRRLRIWINHLKMLRHILSQRSLAISQLLAATSVPLLGSVRTEVVRFVGCGGLATSLAPGRGTYRLVRSAAFQGCKDRRKILKWRHMRAFSGSVSEWCGRADAARLLPQQPPSGRAAAARTQAAAAPAAAWRLGSIRLAAGQHPPRGRTDAAVARRLLPAAAASANGSCSGFAAAEFQRSSRGRSCPPEAGAGQELPSRGRSRAAAAAATPGRATGDFDGKKRVLTGVNASTKRRSFDGQHALTKLIDVSLGRTRRDFGTFGPSERLCMFFGCR